MRPLETLLARSRGPLGPPVVPDGLPDELAALLASSNGFAVFNYGVQVFHTGPRGLGPELSAWNAPRTWKHTYGRLADGLLCFGQDLFGVQFAIEEGRRVSTFDPETGDRHTVGETLDDWAEWLLAKPDERGARALATAWQKGRGALGHDERLLPRTWFVLGGEYTEDNLMTSDAVTAMRARGPIARQLHTLADGAEVRFTVR
jgi:hypothetical protein